MSRRAGMARTPAAPQSPHNANPVGKGLRRTRSVRPTTVPPPLSAAGAGKVRLGDVFDLQMGKTPARARQDYWGGANKWISIADIGKANIVISKTAEGISDKAVIESGIKIVPANTLIMSFKLSIGKTAITAEPMYTNEAIMAFLPKSNVEFDLHYLYHQFSNKDWSLGSNLAVIGLTLNKKSLQEHIILSPPLPTQQRIADELDRLCALKKNAEDRLAILDQIVKSRFVEMFGDVEMNPHGFEVKRLDDVCSSIIRGPFGSALKKEFFIPKSDKAYKVYEQKHAIQKSEKIGSYYVSEEKFKELSRFECRPGDIIMSCSGTMGELFQLSESCEKGIMNQALCKFTLGNKLSPVYFLSFMSRAISKLQTQGSGIKNIAAVSYVKALKFVLPPLTLQREFAAFVAEVDKSKLTLRETVATLDQLYRAKLQEYFG